MKVNISDPESTLVRAADATPGDLYLSDAGYVTICTSDISGLGQRFVDLDDGTVRHEDALATRMPEGTKISVEQEPQ